MSVTDISRTKVRKIALLGKNTNYLGDLKKKWIKTTKTVGTSKECGLILTYKKVTYKHKLKHDAISRQCTFHETRIFFHTSLYIASTSFMPVYSMDNLPPVYDYKQDVWL